MRMRRLQQLAEAPEASKINTLTGWVRQEGPVIETQRGLQHRLKLRIKKKIHSFLKNWNVQVSGQ